MIAARIMCLIRLQQQIDTGSITINNSLVKQNLYLVKIGAVSMFSCSHAGDKLFQLHCRKLTRVVNEPVASRNRGHPSVT